MQGVLAKHNLARGKERTRNPHQVDSGGVMVYVAKSKAYLMEEVKGNERRRKSGGLYETVSKYLNIQQVYIYGKAFLVQNTGSNYWSGGGGG